jgi:hypothetical protein
MASTWSNSWAVPHNKAPMGTSKEEWLRNGYTSMTFVALVIERGPQFKRQPHPVTGRPGNILLMHFDFQGKDYIFANCLVCKSKKFDDAKTPFPLDYPLDGPNQPRLGKCGCVCCNGCVRNCIPNNVNDVANPDMGYIPCPYCKKLRSHEMDTHAWIVSEAMLGNIVLDKNR